MQPHPPLVDHGRRRLTSAFTPVVLVLAVVWAVFIIDGLLHLDLNRFGIHPRHVDGLVGVIAAPLLHGGWDHIAGNSLSALVLGWLMVYFYPKLSLRVMLVCWIAGGFCVWLFGRPSHHIGASGVIYGLASFLFFSGLLKRNLAHAGLSFMVMALYGSWIWGVLPIEPEKSWESHLAGGLVGTVMAFYYRHVPPLHVPPPIELTDDDDEVAMPMPDDPKAAERPSTPWPHGPSSNSTFPLS